jgi:hypothetical protein
MDDTEGKVDDEMVPRQAGSAVTIVAQVAGG